MNLFEEQRLTFSNHLHDAPLGTNINITMTTRHQSRLKLSFKQKDKTNASNNDPQTIPESPQISRRAQFEDTSNNMHVNLHETYVEFSMELPAPNTESYRKLREVDVTVLIVKCKPENDEEEIT